MRKGTRLCGRLVTTLKKAEGLRSFTPLRQSCTFAYLYNAMQLDINNKVYTLLQTGLHSVPFLDTPEIQPWVHLSHTHAINSSNDVLALLLDKPQLSPSHPPASPRWFRCILLRICRFPILFRKSKCRLISECQHGVCFGEGHGRSIR